MTAGELFGTLQASVTAQWQKHLQADRNSVHHILDEYYKEMPEKVDDLIEAYQAVHGVIEDYKDVLAEEADSLTSIEYLEKLKEIVKNGREELLEGETELESLADDVLAFIDSVLYKLQELVPENTFEKGKSQKTGPVFHSLADYLTERLDN